MRNEWPEQLDEGDEQQVQICRIVDEKGQSATAEGLFYQLIVRLHKFSLAREDFNASVHWQRGLILDDDYNGRALLEHIGNDVRITVRGVSRQLASGTDARGEMAGGELVGGIEVSGGSAVYPTLRHELAGNGIVRSREADQE